MITDQMVEDGARALHDAAREGIGRDSIGYWEEYDDDWRAGFRKQARAVLEAALAGRVVIPRPIMTQPYHAKIDNVRRDGVSLVFHTREEAQQVMEALNHDAG